MYINYFFLNNNIVFVTSFTIHIFTRNSFIIFNVVTVIVVCNVYTGWFVTRWNVKKLRTKVKVNFRKRKITRFYFRYDVAKKQNSHDGKDKAENKNNSNDRALDIRICLVTGRRCEFIYTLLYSVIGVIDHCTYRYCTAKGVACTFQFQILIGLHLANQRLVVRSRDIIAHHFSYVVLYLCNVAQASF